MTGPLVLLGWADITQMLDQVIHAKPQSDALPVYVPASMMPRVREVQAGLNESLVQMPWLDPVVSAPAQPYSADQAEELREALAKRLFDAWQATPHCELDGEHTLRWGELAPAYQAAWVAVADAALSHPAQPAPAQPQGPYSADQAKELREAAQRLITAAETAAKHFGYARLGGVSLEDSHVRSELHAWVADLRAALDAPAQPQGAGCASLRWCLRPTPARRCLGWRMVLSRLPRCRPIVISSDGWTQHNRRGRSICRCGDRPASQCDEEWGPTCDLGNNPAHVKVARQPTSPQAASQDPAWALARPFFAILAALAVALPLVAYLLWVCVR
jgi:hypothetical protein